MGLGSRILERTHGQRPQCPPKTKGVPSWLNGNMTPMNTIFALDWHKRRIRIMLERVACRRRSDGHRTPRFIGEMQPLIAGPTTAGRLRGDGVQASVGVDRHPTSPVGHRPQSARHILGVVGVGRRGLDAQRPVQNVVVVGGRAESATASRWLSSSMMARRLPAAGVSSHLRGGAQRISDLRRPEVPVIHPLLPPIRCVYLPTQHAEHGAFNVWALRVQIPTEVQWRCLALFPNPRGPDRY